MTFFKNCHYFVENNLAYRIIFLFAGDERCECNEASRRKISDPSFLSLCHGDVTFPAKNCFQKIYAIVPLLAKLVKYY